MDFENVHTDGVSKPAVVQKGDEIIIMYSENCKNISLDAMNELISRGASLKCFKVSVGTKNALDFQLSSYLGYIVGFDTEHNSAFYIVSKDTGFDRLCDFWSAQDVKIKRIENLDSVPKTPKMPKTQTSAETDKKQEKKTKKKKSKVAEDDMATKADIEKYLSPEEYSTEILAIVNQYKTKQSIMGGISKMFKDSKKAGAVYQKLKPLLKEKKKT